MIYLVTENLCKDLSLPYLTRDDAGLVQLFDRNNDKFFVVDDFLACTRFLNYAQLSYKLVVGIPNEQIEGEFLADREHIILYDHFIKECNAVSQRLQAKEDLKNDLDIGEDNVLEIEAESTDTEEDE